jgi:hypothetical protein
VKVKKKLENSDKVNLVLSREQALRELAKQYDVHHSTIDEVFKESAEVLKKYWDEKSQRQGRPPVQTDSKSEELKASEQEAQELRKQMDLKQMRIDWLELQLKWEHERAAEAKQKRSKQLKKKKKSK